MGRDAPLLREVPEQLLEALVHEAVDGPVDGADLGVAHRLDRDLHSHGVLEGGLVRQIVLTEVRQRRHELRRRRQLGEALGELGAVALGDARDQVLLGGEVDVERAGADQRLLADVLHGRAVKAGAREADLGGVEDVLAAGALRCRFQLGHGWVGPGEKGFNHCLKTKRMIVLFAWHRGSVKAVLRAPIKGLFQPGEGCCTAGHAIADFRIFFRFFSDLPASF